MDEIGLPLPILNRIQGGGQFGLGRRLQQSRRAQDEPPSPTCARIRQFATVGWLKGTLKPTGANRGGSV